MRDVCRETLITRCWQLSLLQSTQQSELAGCPQEVTSGVSAETVHPLGMNGQAPLQRRRKYFRNILLNTRGHKPISNAPSHGKGQSPLALGEWLLTASLTYHFYSAKDTINVVNGLTTDWKKIFVTHITSVRCTISRGLLQMSKPSKLVCKWET